MRFPLPVPGRPPAAPRPPLARARTTSRPAPQGRPNPRRNAAADQPRRSSAGVPRARHRVPRGRRKRSTARRFDDAARAALRPVPSGGRFARRGRDRPQFLSTIAAARCWPHRSQDWADRVGRDGVSCGFRLRRLGRRSQTIAIIVALQAAKRGTHAKSHLAPCFGVWRAGRGVSAGAQERAAPRRAALD